MKKHWKKLVIAVVVVLTALIAMAVNHGIQPLALGLYEPVLHESQLAVQGYDLVEYFQSSKATPGVENYQAEHEGVKYYFANAENRAKFAASPQSYLPQYGGYCAFAVSKGFTAPNKPELFVVSQGKLFLFSNPDVVRDWKVSEASLITAAEANWK